METWQRVSLFLSTFFLGIILLFFLGGVPLAVAYAILWIDKIVIGTFGAVRYIGVEFTTLATLILGIAYGPWLAFAFSIVAIPFLHASRYIFLPLPQPEWPFFIPHPNNIVDSIGALTAGLLSGLPLFYLAIAVTIVKDIGYGLSEKAMFGKPVDYFSAAMYLIFNGLLAFQLGPILLLIG